MTEDKKHIEEEASKKPENETPENTEEEKAEEEPENRDSEIDAKNRQLYERAKKAEQEKKDLQQQIEKLKATRDEPDSYVDEDKTNSRIADLEAELSSMKDRTEREKVFSKYPVLNDKLEEFDTFLEENPGMNLETAGKAFVVENDLFETPKKRKGLEKAGGGAKTAPSNGGKMTSDEAKQLRDSDWKRYRQLLKEGKIQISD